MRRYLVRVDANHKAISAALTAAGCTVQSLASVGGGCPDLLVGAHGRTVLLEVKKVDSKGRLSAGATRSLKGEREWAARWRGGTVHFVSTPEEAIAAAMRGFSATPDPEAKVG